MVDSPFSGTSALLHESLLDDRRRLLEQSEVKPDIDLSQSKVDFDYRKEIDRMAADAKKGDSQIAISDLLPKDMLRTDELMDVDLLLLQQAEKHIAAKQYAQALTKLDAFLTKKPGHPEAIYLRVLCLVSQEDQGEVNTLAPQIRARKALEPLLGKTRMPLLSQALRERVEMLRLRIGAQAQARVLLLFVLEDHEALYESVAELQRLDPDCPEYAFFTALLLQEMNRIVDAFDVVEGCVQANGGKVPPGLAGLRTHLEAQHVYQLLQPAIRSLKRQDFSGARKALEQVDSRFTAARDFLLFQAYARKLDGGGIFGMFSRKRSLAQVKPDGSYADRDRLQGLLIREEIVAAKARMKGGKFADAEGVLNKALTFAPDYGFACYLLAGCVFRRNAEIFTAGKTTDFKGAGAELVRCRHLLKTAAADPELTRVKDLVEQVEVFSRVMGEIEAHLRRRQEEVNIVKAQVEGLKALMGSVPGGGFSSRADLARFKGLAETGLGAVASAKKKVSSDDARQALEHLEEQYRMILAQIRGM